MSYVQIVCPEKELLALVSRIVAAEVQSADTNCTATQQDERKDATRIAWMDFAGYLRDHTWIGYPAAGPGKKG